MVTNLQYFLDGLLYLEENEVDVVQKRNKWVRVDNNEPIMGQVGDFTVINDGVREPEKVAA